MSRLGVPGLELVPKVSNFPTVCDVLVRVMDQRRDEQGRVMLQVLGPGEQCEVCARVQQRLHSLEAEDDMQGT